MKIEEFNQGGPPELIGIDAQMCRVRLILRRAVNGACALKVLETDSRAYLELSRWRRRRKETGHHMCWCAVSALRASVASWSIVKRVSLPHRFPVEWVKRDLCKLCFEYCMLGERVWTIKRWRYDDGDDDDDDKDCWVTKKHSRTSENDLFTALCSEFHLWSLLRLNHVQPVVYGSRQISNDDDDVDKDCPVNKKDFRTPETDIFTA